MLPRCTAPGIDDYPPWLLRAVKSALSDIMDGPSFSDARQILEAIDKILPGDPATPARELVNEQANDDGLWFVAETAAEAYLQQELRRLHAAVEGI